MLSIPLLLRTPAALSSCSNYRHHHRTAPLPPYTTEQPPHHLCCLSLLNLPPPSARPQLLFFPSTVPFITIVPCYPLSSITTPPEPPHHLPPAIKNHLASAFPSHRTTSSSAPLAFTFTIPTPSLLQAHSSAQLSPYSHPCTQPAAISSSPSAAPKPPAPHQTASSNFPSSLPLPCLTKLQPAFLPLHRRLVHKQPQPNHQLNKTRTTP